MRINRLKLEGFKSYAFCDLGLSGTTACSIVGGNGSGKSTLAEAIVWALFGYSKYSSNRELLHPGMDKASVELQFSVDGHEYCILRSFSEGSSSVNATVDGQPLSKYISGVLPAVTQALGASRELIAESVIIQQGQLSSFILATPAERRDLIMSMLGLDKYTKAHDVARESLKTMQNTVASHDQSIDTLRNELKNLPEIAEVEVSMQALTDKLTVHTERIKDLTGKREHLLLQHQQSQQMIQTCNEQINELQRRIDDAQSKAERELNRNAQLLSDADRQINSLPLLTERAVQLQTELEQVQELEQKAQSLQVTMSHYESSIKDQRAKISVASKAQDVCPLCGTQLTPEKWQQIYNDMQTTLSAMIQQLQQVDTEAKQITIYRKSSLVNKSLSETKDAITKVGMITESRQAIVDHIGRITAERDGTVAALQLHMDDVREKMAGLDTTVSQEIVAIDTKLAQERSTHTTITDELSTWVSHKKARTTLEASLSDIEGLLQTSKEKLPETEFVVQALSPSGIPLLLVDHYLPLIESKAREILSEMSDGQLNISLQILDGKKVELLAGEGQLRPIRSLSGGEQTKASLALRLALSQTLFDMTGCKFDCMVIDEPEYLDAHGVSQFISAVSRLRSIFPQIFVISHIPEIKSAFPQTIEITKRNGVSTAKLSNA